jgi:hypothetical protein
MEWTMVTAVCLAAAAALGQPQTAPLAAPAGTAQTTDALDAELAALEAEYAKAQGEFRSAYQAAATPEERQKVYEEQYPAGRFVERFQALAEKAGASDTGAAAWLQVLTLGSQLPGGDSKGGAGERAVDKALEQLLSVHVQSARLEQLCAQLSYMDPSKSEPGLRKVLEKSPHRAVQGCAAYYLANVLQGERISAGDPAKRKAEAVVLYERVKQDFADVPLYGEKTLGAAADGALFEMNHLQIGMAAPDFESVDQDGVKFKVSDYRGKVVVLDFWGFW